MSAVSESANLTDRLGFLLATRGDATKARIQIAMGAVNLPPRHAMTLMHLRDGPRSQREIADILEIDPSQLVAILNDLECRGQLERRRDPIDRRRHIVELTEAGAATLEAMQSALDEAERELFSGLSEADRALLRDLLNRVSVTVNHGECAGEMVPSSESSAPAAARKP